MIAARVRGIYQASPVLDLELPGKDLLATTDLNVVCDDKGRFYRVQGHR